MKKLFLLFVLVVSSVSVLHAGKSYPILENVDQVKFLDNKEISEIFKGGHTIVGTNLKWKKEAIQNYKEDGTYDGSVANGKKKIAGKWVIENNMICHFPRNKNKKMCRAIYKDGDYFVELNPKNNKIILKFKLR